MRKRSGTLLLIASLVFALAQCSSPERNPPVAALSGTLEPLRAQFNQEAGKVRLLLIVDPH